MEELFLNITRDLLFLLLQWWPSHERLEDLETPMIHLHDNFNHQSKPFIILFLFLPVQGFSTFFLFSMFYCGFQTMNFAFQVFECTLKFVFPVFVHVSIFCFFSLFPSFPPTLSFHLSLHPLLSPLTPSPSLHFSLLLLLSTSHSSSSFSPPLYQLSSVEGRRRKNS